MTILRSITAIALILLVPVSCATAQPVAWTDLLSKAGTFDKNANNFNLLSSFLDYAGITNNVLALRSSTVFAPTDAAFIIMANEITPYKGSNEREAYDALINFTKQSGPNRGPELAKLALLYHVVPYPMDKNHIISNSYFVPTLAEGQTFLLTKSVELVDATPYRINPVVIKSDIRVVSNNIVHVINHILVPDVSRSLASWK